MNKEGYISAFKELKKEKTLVEMNELNHLCLQAGVINKSTFMAAAQILASEVINR